MLILRVVLSQGQFCPPGTFVDYPQTSLIVQIGAASRIQWVGARDSAKHLTMHSTVLHNKDGAQHADSSVVEKPRLRGSRT